MGTSWGGMRSGTAGRPGPCGEYGPGVFAIRARVVQILCGRARAANVKGERDGAPRAQGGRTHNGGVTIAAPDPYAILRLPEFRFLLAANAFSTLASRSLAVVIGFQVYALTKDTLALGTLGLVEAIPALSLALFGGVVADRFDRRTIVLTTGAVSVLCAVLFALLSARMEASGVAALYGVVFAAGFARGFSEPAASAFEAQVVPRELFASGSAWISSVWQGCSIAGPALAGFAYAAFGAGGTYWVLAVLFSLAWLSMRMIAPKPRPVPVPGESVGRSIALGVRYVFRHQVIVGSMSLDLFAVLFGGAIALLPVFATDILNVGPRGLGLLAAAPAVGALAVMLVATRRPPARHAGRDLILAVAGFGVSMIVFGLSRNFALSLVALVASGMFDGLSMVIRRTILRVMSPEHMRGRIASVSSIFIGSSNEIGAFESGVLATLLGTARSVWLGGVVTLVVVGAVAVLAPKLRALDLTQDHAPEDGA